MASIPISSLIDLNSTFGALFIGFGASSLAFGVLSMQAWNYFRRYPSDVWWYKCLVGMIWYAILELVDQALIGHAVYFYIVTKWGQVSALLQGPIWYVQVALGATVGALVKICFGMRVWRFSRHNILITMLIVSGNLPARPTAARSKNFQPIAIPSIARVGELKLVGSIALGLGMATDVVTAAALCYFLRGLKTGYRRDDSIVNTLTLYAINTGVITSAISLSTLILYDLMPTNFIFMAFYFVLSKVYANSFFAALNTRRSIRGRGTEGDHTTVPTFLMVGQTTKQEVHVDPVYSIVRSRTQVDLAASSSSPSASYAKAPGNNASDDFLDMSDRSRAPLQQSSAGANRSQVPDVEYSPRMEVPREPVSAALRLSVAGAGVRWLGVERWWLTCRLVSLVFLCVASCDGMRHILQPIAMPPPMHYAQAW
ncbi:hypothetical protein BV20DRAFT_945400 [Pilatotrama ljubarskyi]|nr:hypothetical protein BV20DRAFT_945400 [Pilatotrama ljubarskyi]